MDITILFLLVIGLVAIWIAIKNAEEVHRLALSTTSFISLIWGFILTPDWVQIWLSIILLTIYTLLRIYLKL
ncbi:MAG: hypothetical protein QNJ68_19240 [Microcoleaceae cyanobacterium MO_207.B10]|nr:hypothetical protein [Microcoleaceae cyanobacterium MO_207.B10]